MASSLPGMAHLVLGGVSAPLVGVAGAATMLPLGIVTVASIGLAAASVALLAPRREVFDLTLPVEQAAEDYRAMDGAPRTKVLLTF